MRFQWIGGPTFYLELGRFRILTDPMFGEGPAAFVMNGHPSTGEDNAAIARLAPLPALDLAGLDLVLVSHLHSDHFDPAARQRLDKALPVVAPAVQVPRLAEWGFTAVAGLDWWDRDERAEDGERLAVTAVPARHSHDDDTNRELGVVNGYLIEHAAAGRRYRIYWTGDTVFFAGLAEIAERSAPVDLLVPHLGAVGRDGPWGRMTLDAEEAAQLTDLVAPARILPIHHHTFSHYVEGVDAFAARLAGGAHARRLTVLAEGETAELA